MSEARTQNERLDRANAILTNHVPKPAPGAKERVWRGVDRHRRPWRMRFGWPEAVVFAAALAVVFFVQRTPTPEVEWRTVAAGEAVSTHGATVRTLGASTVRTPVVKDGRTVVQVVDGHLDFDVAPRAIGESFVVQTRHAIVTVVGTRFAVRADDDGTVVEVEEGTVEVAPRSGTARRLLAGEQIRIASAASIARADERVAQANRGEAIARAVDAEVPAARDTKEAESTKAPASSGGPAVSKSRERRAAPRARVVERGDAASAAERGEGESPGGAARAEGSTDVNRAAGSHAPAALQVADQEASAPSAERGPGATAPSDSALRAQVVSPKERLRIARKVVASDASRAAELASSVLDEAPAPALEAEALAVLADARRRAGDDAEAAELYRALADHPAASAYGEEALLQLALVSRNVGRLDTARAALETANARYPHGPLALERAALGARLALADGAPGRAAAILLAAPNDGLSLELIRTRLDVAEVVVEGDAELARRLLAVDRSSWPDGLARRAEALQGRLER
ncbi:MAG: FecR domain-containing protein [Deltaproteobacteria bacterium]|jgi:TolA-binding protein